MTQDLLVLTRGGNAKLCPIDVLGTSCFERGCMGCEQVLSQFLRPVWILSRDSDRGTSTAFKRTPQ